MATIDRQKASQSNSTTAFVTALAVNAGLLAAEVGVFLILKTKLWRVYSPRAYLPPPDKRADELPGGLWRWFPALLRSPTKEIIQKNGLDAYMFLRFIKLLVWIFLAFTIVTFLVIIPADAVNIQSTLTGVERISWSNIVDPRDQHRFAAHVIVVYVLTAFVVYMIHREMHHFVQLRHQFLLSPSHSKLAQSRTVLITSIPEELGNEQDIKTFASFVPGGVDRVWLYRDTKTLNELFERRQELCELLEAAESALLKQATKAWRKRVKAHAKAQRKKPRDVEHNPTELAKPEPSIELLQDLVPPHKRPMHRTGLLRLVGTKVDTINWCKEEIAKINVSIAELRKDNSERKFLGSAFIRCNLQMGAHILAQCVSYHEPLKMVDKWMDAHPKDIVWNNLDDGALEMKGRYITSWMATVGLIIAWTFPVSFIGTLSNLGELCTDVKWLAWVCDLPDVVRGLIEGVLPPGLLAVLFALLPFILQALAWYECIARYSLISVSVYKRFYFFLLIHGFLVVTLTSGLTNAIGQIIQNPTKTVTELAKELPGASVFFLTYMVTQGLAGAGNALAQFVPLILHYVRKWFLGRTPRQAYAVTFMMPAADFGVVLPRLSLLATIAFAYSVLSPLINLLALLSFGMFYIAWKFLFVQVFDQPDETETGGMYFPMAVGNLFVGLYIEHICLAALFFMRAPDEGAGAVVKAIFMLVLLGLTAVAQLFMSNSFDHLIHYLPMSLATKKMAKKFEKEKRRRTGTMLPEDNEEELDLFSRSRIRSVRRRVKKTVEEIKGRSSDDSAKAPLADGAAEMAAVTSLEMLERHMGGELQRQKTNDSTHSQHSNHSNRSNRSDNKPKVVFDAPAPRVTMSDDSDDSDEEAADDHAFDHPSTYQEQAWIWIPKDPLGLSEVLAKDLRSAGVDASDVGAFMDEHGVVEVRRNPPDEEWAGGHDA
ncbi:DUF221 family protein [Coprinopsis cinerea AmutBmut pab1-1]|nr:DUF221 family protein [Coprinopsis cinerea AmutBmut pab1-1]